MSRKPKLTPEELSAVRAAAGKKGAASRIAQGHSRGGRKPGFVSPRKGTGKGRAPMRSLSARKPDYDVLVAYADMAGIAIAEALHRICLGLVQKYPQLAPAPKEEASEVL